ncbi:3-keto-5-aminohexanoate cleavage protein [Oceanibacterium hippocampi]|uniref:3-keto-5-aminohexanoate cleavage enzyme n=1 Tax=Oceanibacterium hippocampi TaxID=745714 RepID=A0A1Y5TUY1_9PROT|nr:3-keto-5-aminohexanoate cleavage protein [Oceanibacterium hippocampi]SLN70318.1 3-keto-5-aminohexanoate cleavage enzyme [Oceanibacterium hippocampi]
MDRAGAEVEPLYIAVAPNGARKTKSDHPALPMSAAEIAETAAAAAAAGAAMLHLHVRDDDGAHSLDVGRYREATEAVRARVGDGLVIQATTEAVGRYSAAEQMALVRELRPEAVSLALRELAPAGEERAAAQFFDWLAGQPIMPQFILYDAADVIRFRALRKAGVVPPGRHFLLFVLGRYVAAGASSPRVLLPFLEANEEDDPWAVCAFGPQEQACMAAAMALGGHVRVGFENNVTLPDGGTAADNSVPVAHSAALARAIGRPIGTAAAMREAFGGA